MSKQPSPADDAHRAVPNTLREREQWICWRLEERDGDETKVPIKPYRAQDHAYASSTDAETWRSYDEALEYHRTGIERTDGVGFVFSEDDVLLGVDLDDCRDPATGELEAWAEEIVDELDSFTEVSPSGTGLHIYVLAIHPGDSNKTVVDEDLWEFDGESELELYDRSRFFTFTGERVGDVREVEQRNAKVRTVYDRHFDDDENDEHLDGSDEATVEVEPVDVDLDDEELLEKAKAAGNGNRFERLWRGSDSMHGGDTSRADLALCTQLAFWTGGDRARIDRLFRSSGRARAKWDEDRGSQTYGERTIEKALELQTEYYQPGGSGPASVDVDVDEDGSGAHSGLSPAHFGVSVYRGGYGAWKTRDDDEDVWQEWSNFLLELDAILETPDGGEVLQLTVEPRESDAAAYEVAVEPTAFNDSRTFKREVCVGITATWSGNDRDLARLKQFVGSQEAPRKRGTHHLGYHPDEQVWITPDGALGADGWLDDDEAGVVYLERGLASERKVAISPSSHPDAEFDGDVVREILELLPQTRNSERLLPLLGWFYSAPLRPLIHGWTGQFNLMSVTGETGSGKTTTISTLWELLGMSGDPFSANDTEFVLLATLASSSSIPMWFDEYKPSDMDRQQVNQFLAEIRKTTRGGIGQRGNADQSTTEYHLEAPVIVSGEERIRGSAEERRAIFATLRKDSTEEGSDTSKAHAQLTGGAAKVLGVVRHYDGLDLTQHAIAYARWLCDQDVDELREIWQASREHVDELLRGLGIAGLEDLVEQGLQTIKFGCTLYRAFASSVGAGADVIETAEIDQAISHTIAGDGDGNAQRTTHIDALIEVAGRAALAGYLKEGEHYRFVYKGSDREQLRLSLLSSHDLIKRYAREQYVSEDILDNKSDYDSRLRDGIGSIPYLEARSQWTEEIGSALSIDVAAAEEHLDGFGRWLFDEESGARESTWQPLATEATGRINITATATNVERGDLPDAIAETGTLEDQTKAIDYVVFASDRADVPHLEAGVSYGIKGVRLGEYEGEPQLVLDAGVSSIREIEPGFEYVPAADPGPNETIAEAAADGGDQDGELEQTSEIVRRIVVEQQPITATGIKGYAAGAGLDVELERIDDVVADLVERGRVADLGDGYEIP